MYSRVNLSDGSASQPASIPIELVGLEDVSLADLAAALDPVPAEFDGIGFWPARIGDVDFDPREMALTGRHELRVDRERRMVFATPELRDLTPGEIVDLPPLPVPAVVSMRQARLALLFAGHLTRAEEILAAMPGEEGQAARIEWEYAIELRRDHRLVRQLGAQLGLDDAAKDDLFRAAAQIA